MKKVIGLALAFALLISANAFATDSYSDAVGERLERGLTNTLFGWTKIFSVPHAYQAEKKNPWAGVGEGLVDAVHCTVTGAFNLLTFPVAAEMSGPNGCVDLGSTPAAPVSEDWEGGKQVAPVAEATLAVK